MVDVRARMGWDETRYVTGKGVVDTGLAEFCGEIQKRAFVFRLGAGRVSSCVRDVAAMIMLIWVHMRNVWR